MTRVLIVDDESAMRLALQGLFRKEGFEVDSAESAVAALEALRTARFDLVVTDLKLGRGGSGLDVLAEAQRSQRETPVILITAQGSEKIAVDAMKAGAAHYVAKPFDNDELRLVARRELERTKTAREHRLLLERVERERGMGAMVGTGPEMQRVFDVIGRVAETDLGVLVRGESGTGKELVAEALHRSSTRRARPFVAVNCAAIGKELVESELFGHERGAFTGADARRIGRFESAAGGTIFLDEIGDMPLDTQAKVLRVLESRTFERVGGTTPITTDARVVAATHRDLARDVREGRFREDLYYRLHVIEIVVPPLRERREDIPVLALRFAASLAEKLKREPRVFSNGALAALARHGWPGNVRELRHAVEQACVLAPGDAIEADDLRLSGASSRLPSATEAASYADAKQRAIEDFERAWLGAALAAHDGNVSRTAAAIGLARQSLQQKLRELGLRGSRDKDEGES